MTAQRDESTQQALQGLMNEHRLFAESDVPNWQDCTIPSGSIEVREVE